MKTLDKLADGWRLPTKDELASLLWGKLAEGDDSGGCSDDDGDAAVAAEYRKVFYSAESWFWSSSAYKRLGADAWYVHFGFGVFEVEIKDAENQVRLVRGQLAAGSWKYGDKPEDRYAISECGNFVADHKTGLEWQREPEAGKFTWHEAVKRFSAREHWALAKADIATWF